MKKLTTLFLTLLLLGGTVTGCRMDIPQEKNAPKVNSAAETVDIEPVETKNDETTTPEEEIFWKFVHTTIDNLIYTYLETNAVTPTSIEDFREPSVEPKGLIKKVLEQNSDYHLIIYVQSENDGYFNAIYTLWQFPVPPEGEDIKCTNYVVHHPTEVNGYEAYWNDTFYIVRGEEPKKEGLALTWHDD